MKRWVIDRHGRDNLRIEEVPVQRPRRGEALVRVRAVALKARDLMMLETGMGLKLTFPFVPTSDMAGIVEEVGAGVTRFRVVDRVISNSSPNGSTADPEERHVNRLTGRLAVTIRVSSLNTLPFPKIGSRPLLRRLTMRKRALCQSPG